MNLNAKVLDVFYLENMELRRRNHLGTRNLAKEGKEKGTMAATILALAAGQKASAKAGCCCQQEGTPTQMKALVSSINGNQATTADSTSTGVVASATATAPKFLFTINGILQKAKHG
jgi:hypothetical protein